MLTRILTAYFALLCGVLSAQTCDLSRFARVVEWSGTFTLTGSAHGTVDLGFGSSTDYTVQQTIMASPDLTINAAGGLVPFGNLNASIDFLVQLVTHRPGGSTSTETDTGNTFTAVGQSGLGFQISMSPTTCTYSLVYDPTFIGQFMSQSRTQAGLNEWGPPTGPAGLFAVVANIPIPAQGFIFSGSIPSFSSPALALGNDPTYPVNWTVNWNLVATTLPCNFNISPGSQTFSSAGGAGVVTVGSDPGCQWGAASPVDWVTINSGTPGTGNGAVGYDVASNTGTERTTILTVAGKPFTVNQGPCTYNINPTSQDFSDSGGAGTVSVTASATTCPWLAVSSVGWVSITSGDSGVGNGSVGYTVAANSGPPRTGTLDIAGQTFTVNQAGCMYTIDPTSQNFPQSGGTGGVSVTASSSSCPWTAVSGVSWVTITSGAAGSGNGTVGYTVATNNSQPRTGTLTIASQTFTVDQDGACAYGISTSSAHFISLGGNGSVNVTAQDGCFWAANSNVPWIVITSPSNGGGNGTVTYTVLDNPSTQMRTGVMTIANLPVTVTEDGKPLLSIAKSHTGNFAGGQSSAIYTAVVSNSASAGPTISPVAVTETPPSGLSFVSMMGTGWICTGTTCSRGDALAPGGSYPPITITVNVNIGASSPQVNAVGVSGGGSVPASATDPTVIMPPRLSISKTHTGDFAQGQQGAVYTVTVANATGAGTTFGTVTVSETPPAGLTLASMTGTGWQCGSGSCNRSDPLAGGSSYPPITVMVNVSQTAGSPVINQVSVSGGGSASAMATDPTTVVGNGTPPSGLEFFPVTPCRVLDTRNPGGPFGGPALSAGETRNVAIQTSACAIPTTAQAYSFNVTVVPMAQLGFLTIWPTGQPQPNVSTLNSLNGAVLANAAIVPAGPSTGGGSVSVFVTDVSQVILDINGYFAPSQPNGLAFYPATPCRVADTRSAGGRLGAGATRTFNVPQSVCGIPSTALAYSLNMTVVPLGPLGFLTTWPTGQSQPLVSTLNALQGQIVANAAIVPAGSNGAINVFVSDPTDVIIDVDGYFAMPPAGSSSGPTPLYFYPVSPCRIADTRLPAAPLGGPPLSAAATRTFPILPSLCGLARTAQAYSLNMTVVPPAPLFFLTTWPTGLAQPVVSTLNDLQGQVIANAAIVPGGSGGAINVFASDATHLIIDVNGYFDQ